MDSDGLYQSDGKPEMFCLCVGRIPEYDIFPQGKTRAVSGCLPVSDTSIRPMRCKPGYSAHFSRKNPTNARTFAVSRRVAVSA